MTDNCSTMIGKDMGFLTRKQDACVAIIRLRGCSSHQANLVHKEDVNSSEEFTKVIKFAEGFSAFVSSSLKARSLLQQVQEVCYRSLQEKQ